MMKKKDHEDLRDLHNSLDNSIKMLMDIRKTFPIPGQDWPENQEFEDQEQEDWRDRFNHSWDHREYLLEQLKNLEQFIHAFDDAMSFELFCLPSILDFFNERISTLKGEKS